MGSIKRYDRNFMRKTEGGWVAIHDHLDFVKEAVLAERERCAKIVGSLHLGAADHACYSEFEHHRILFAESEIKRGANQVPPPIQTPKLAVGDEVFVSDPLHFFNGVRGTITGIRRMPNPDPYYVVLLPGERKEELWLRAKDLTLHVPPTPAELIPTLKEHEWVRGTMDDGRSFEGFTHLHYGVMVAGEVLLLLPPNGTYGYVATIERCEQPVKP